MLRNVILLVIICILLYTKFELLLDNMLKVDPVRYFLILTKTTKIIQLFLYERIILLYS